MIGQSQLLRLAPMTSFRQIEANRRNARKGTGPTTEQGKERSRCNADPPRTHGGNALEDAEDYKAFEGAIIADTMPSLRWRPRRATTMETGLFRNSG
jgi:hypothetical protein